MTYGRYSEADLTWREKRLQTTDVLASLYVSAVLVITVIIGS